MSDVIADALAAHAESGSGSYDSLGNVVTSAADMVPESTIEVDTSAGNESPPAADTLGGDPATPVVATPEGGTTAAAVAQDEIDKLLEAEGIKPPQVGIRENRIPYSRTKGIIANAQKKWTADLESKFATERQQFETVAPRLRNYEAQEQLATADPDRYIAALAAVDPRYAKFLGGVGASGKPEPQMPAADADPEPQPDTDPATGQKYYTPEKWNAVQSWNRRQAVRDAQAEMEKKYGPVLSKALHQEEAQRAYEQRVPVVQAQMKRLNDTYGAEMIKSHEGAIVAEMRRAEAQGIYLTPSEAAAAVLTPVLRADEASIRAKVLAEMNGRPAAAQTGSPARAKAVTETTGPLSGEDLIRAELDRAMPNRNR